MLDEPPFAKRAMPGAQQPDAAMQQQAAGVEDPDAVQEEDAAPEEQATYDELMRHAYAVMADEKAFPQLEKMLETDPVNAITDATVTIIERIEQDKGEQDTDMLQAIAAEIIPNLAELAEEKGADIPEDQLEQAYAAAIGKWSAAHPDRVDQQGMEAIGNATLNAVQGQAAPQPGGAGV